MRLPFFSKTERSLGIDLGTSSIKAVQLSALDGTLQLETYGEIRAEQTADGAPEPTVSLAEADLADMILEVVTAAKAKPENVTIGVPTFSSFVVNFDLPQMSEEELTQAVPFQARKYVPVSLEEVSLDWSVASTVKTSGGAEMLSVLLVAIPNELIHRLIRIAQRAGLSVAALEMETFALSRAVIGKNKAAAVLVDVGAYSTDLAVVENGLVQIVHNVEIAGIYLTQGIARSLNVSKARAEQLKQTASAAANSSAAGLKELLGPYFELIASEIERIIGEFTATTGRKVGQAILAGSGALQIGLGSHLSQKLGMNVSLADPFATTQYPPGLAQTLKNLGPTYAVAAGLAMRHFKDLSASR